MNRQSPLTHALLQTTTADVILIQEPWIGTVNMAWSDFNPLGTAIPGATNNNMWEVFLPSFTDPKEVRVAAYVKYNLVCTFSVVNNLSHPLSTLESMVLDFSFEDKSLCIVNIYHCVPTEPRQHSLFHILSHELDPLLPTLLVGDFNTHSHIWSFPYSTVSPWASDLVDWFDNQGLELLNPPCVAMWESGRDDQ